MGANSHLLWCLQARLGVHRFYGERQHRTRWLSGNLQPIDWLAQGFILTVSSSSSPSRGSSVLLVTMVILVLMPASFMLFGLPQSDSCDTKAHNHR